MTIYLTIITTVLVGTQIIRISQNAIQLHRQNTMKKDFELLRKAYKLMVEYLENK